MGTEIDIPEFSLNTLDFAIQIMIYLRNVLGWVLRCDFFIVLTRKTCLFMWEMRFVSFIYFCVCESETVL
jgi:hypothetical protein